MTRDRPIRKSARLVLFNEVNEIFLLQHVDPPDRPDPRQYWVTPGGGVEPGESWEQAALRELWEETGIRDVPLGPWVWSREADDVTFAGQAVHCVERYYLVRVADPEVHTRNQLAWERAVYRHLRWWSLAAIGASPEVFYPDDLVCLLQPLVAGDLPSRPVVLRP